MSIDSSNINAFWCSLIVEELARNGVTMFCISPGSRSAPLTVAAARNPAVETVICLDERGAAFYALGYGRAQARPAALVCTSGTAAAHYFPAIIEARMDAVPLIALTADRPPELRNTGANQTIDQANLFGAYVRWFVDMPCPDEALDAQFALTTIDQAVHRALGSDAGPVHVNCMFREPLAPKIVPHTMSAPEEWTRTKRAFTGYRPVVKTAAYEGVVETAKIINGASKGIVAVGKVGSQKDAQALTTFLQYLGWPVFADIQSGLRLGTERSNVIHYFDRLLVSEFTDPSTAPEVILHFGGGLTSKQFLLTLAKWRCPNYIVVNAHPERLDPQHSVTHRFESDIFDFTERLQPLVIKGHTESYLQEWLKASDAVEQVVTDISEPEIAVSEISVARIVSEIISKDQVLYLSSSMPVRDMDMFAARNGASVITAANRGVSGIDGIIASAVGFGAGWRRPVTLIIGDIACFHDINSLALAAASNVPIVIIIINNAGGGIFSFLPIADHTDVFQEFFATPHTTNFEAAAQMVGIPYACATTNEELMSLYDNALRQGVSTIIEVQTDRDDNVALHREVQAAIISAVEGVS